MIGAVHRWVRTATVSLVLLFAASGVFAQEDERAQFKDFNWFDIMKLDAASAFNALWDHAAKYKAASYDQKGILSALLDDYASAKELEKLFPFDTSIDAKAPGYSVTYDRTYGDRLVLPWASLLKLNVRTAMQYILLEILYTKGVPKSKGKVPTNVSLFGEYFRYYAVMKKAG
jgi:hypothetical protein